jgi:transposase
MVKYTQEQRTRLVETYFTSNGYIVAVQRDFRQTFNVRSSPSYDCIINLVKRFREFGTVSDRKRSGRPRAARSEFAIQNAYDDVQENPKTSLRRRSNQLQISVRSLGRIMNQMKFHPYKVQLTQKLEITDHQKRLDLARTFLQLSDAHDGFISHLFMSDEAHFHLSGYVNKQNCRYWSAENPRILHELPLHPQKVTVWCGMTSERIIGPYFFQNQNGETATIIGASYRKCIEECLIPQIQDVNMWFQQDGATAHTARESIQLLKTIFPDRLISRFGDIPWAPRSCDLTPLDFFLWGYLKSKVYINRPRVLWKI